MISYNQICSDFPYINNINFVSESNQDSSRKTFLLNDVIIKSRKLNKDKTAHLRHNDLKEEYRILELIDSLRGVPKVLHYDKNEVYELLFLSYQPGVQLCYQEISFVQTIKVIIQVIVILIRLSLKGICHNDVIPQNILITNKYEVSLIDYDQAVRTTFLKAIVGNIFGIRIETSKVSFGLNTIVKDYLRKRIPDFYYSIKKLLNRNPKFEEHKLPEIKNEADPKLIKLRDAWELAQKSNASSPALPVAYYSFDFEGYHFPGERPWIDNWNRLRNVSSYSGRTILELGCNMGLLSTHLLKEEGAIKCIGIDHDKKILESGKLIGEVFEVNPVLKQIDFDSTKDWESELLNYNIDIVFALNILNYVYDQERFLIFLAKFPEIIYEGRDSIHIERKRFEEIGFKSIEEIGYSERERIILRCRK